MLRTANPALNDRVFRSIPISASSSVMTLDGAVNKTSLAIGITILSAWWAWSHGLASGQSMALIIPSIIVALIISITIIFKNHWAPVLTPLFAIAEGIVLGVISAMAEAAYPGIVFQAVSLTMGTLVSLLLAYKSNLIPVTENFKLGVAAATGAIFVVYLLNFIFSFFGMPFSFLHSSSLLSIGISCVVVVIAALNLVLDFDFIEKGAKAGNLPKYMEWYAAFGLLVTLVWLYMEILRLLMKLNSRDR